MDSDTDWTESDAAAAGAEGWAIFRCYGSNNGPWQLQRFDHPADHGDAPSPYPFGADTDVWVHVRSRAAAGSGLHQRALDFLAANNRTEHAAIMSWRG
jgi:hypothetical protein